MPYIKASVGIRNGTQCYNVVDDQNVVIGLLNQIPADAGGTADYKITSSPRWGTCSYELYQAILTFQGRYSLPVDGHVDPGGLTILRLNQAAGDQLPAAPSSTSGSTASVLSIGTNTPWYVSNLALTGATYAMGVGAGLQTGSITFTQDLSPPPSVNLPMTGGGASVGASIGIPDKMSKLFGEAASTAVKTAINLASNLSVSIGSFDSTTKGICCSLSGDVNAIDSSSFAGTCCGVYVSGNSATYGGSGYVLLFGMPKYYWIGIVAALVNELPSGGLSNVAIAGMLYQAKGIAFIGSYGGGLSLSAGVSFNQFIGVIGG